MWKTSWQCVRERKWGLAGQTSRSAWESRHLIFGQTTEWHDWEHSESGQGADFTLILDHGTSNFQWNNIYLIILLKTYTVSIPYRKCLQPEAFQISGFFSSFEIFAEIHTGWPSLGWKSAFQNTPKSDFLSDSRMLRREAHWSLLDEDAAPVSVCLFIDSLTCRISLGTKLENLVVPVKANIIMNTLENRKGNVLTDRS